MLFIQGDRGPKGVIGRAGLFGKDGENGLDGPQGPPGIPGPKVKWYSYKAYTDVYILKEAIHLSILL